MSLNYAASLLQRYNKNMLPKKDDDDASAVRKKIGTWSYANRYDQLYEKYSKDKNFNINMWRDAVKEGEAEQYIAFLEHDKDVQFSDAFYDPKYYDYKTMMLEMYLPLADKTNTDEMRTTEVFDPMSGETTIQEIGAMSDYDYFNYLLDSSRQMRNAEITYELEREHKENMGFWTSLGHNALATLYELGEGAISAMAGSLDVFGSIGYASYKGVIEDDNWLDAFVDYYADDSLTALEKQNFRAALDEYERKNTVFRDIDGNITGWGKYVAGIANSVGMMLPSIAMTKFIPVVGPTLGQTSFYASIFSGNMYENAQKDTPAALAIANAGIKAGAEYIIEHTLGKLLGPTADDVLRGVTGKIGKNFAKLTKWSGVKYLAKSALQEGVEETLQDASGYGVDWLTDFSISLINEFTAMELEGWGNEGFTAQTLVDSFLAGILCSLVMSGGTIGINSISSGIVNAKAKKAGEYNTELGFGPGDLVIETETGIQKLTGATKLYFSNMLSDFSASIEMLGDRKIPMTKKYNLAQEVYAGITVLSQYYSSFDQTRLKNCEELLSRVVKAERYAELHHSAKDFGAQINTLFNEMVSHDAISTRKAAEAALRAVERDKDRLKAGGATDVVGVADDKGNITSSQEVQDFTAMLGKKGVAALNELNKKYAWVFLTNGHVAIPADEDMLFVPVPWLKNYEVSDIYKFLHQSEVLDCVTTDKELLPMINEVTKFYREFAKQPKATTEEATMNFLFNSTVYQAFLLSNGGQNAHKFSKFIFHLYETIRGLSEASGYTVWAGKEAKVRVNLLKKILKEIKSTMREPIIKAVINWGFKLEEIDPGDILTEEDRRFIEQEKRRRATLAAPLAGAPTQAHEHLVEDIVTYAGFNQEEYDIVKRRNNRGASVKDKLIARGLLDIADRRMGHWYDYDIAVPLGRRHLDAFIADIYTLIQRGPFGTPDTAYAELIQYLEQASQMSISADVLAKVNDYLRRMKAAIAGPMRTYAENRIPADIKSVAQEVRALLVEARDSIPLPDKKTTQALTIPPEALRVDLPDNHADSQFVADVLNEFTKRYGITAKQMISGDIERMSASQRRLLEQDAKELGTDGLVDFVCKQLEVMLGDRFTVVPRRTQIGRKSGPTVNGPEFQVIGFDKNTFVNPKDYTELLGRVKDEKHAIFRYFDTLYRNIKKISSEETAYKWLVNFDDAAYLIRPQTYSDVRDYLPESATQFFKEFDKHWQQDETSKEVLEWLLENERRVHDILDELQKNLENARKDLNPATYIYDFVVAKKIQADKVLSKEFLELDREDRNEVFVNMFPKPKRNRSVEALQKDATKRGHKIVTKTIDAWLKRPDLLALLDKDTGDAKEYLNQLRKYTDENAANVVAILSEDDIIDPLTGEVVWERAIGGMPEQGTRAMLFLEMRFDNWPWWPTDPQTASPIRGTRELGDFLDLSIFDKETQKRLSHISVIFEDRRGKDGGYWNNREICVATEGDDYIDTLIHEFNHVLQSVFDMPGGFNWDDAGDMPDLLQYVLDEYKPVFLYNLRRQGSHPMRLEDLKNQKILPLEQLTVSEKESLAMVAYYLVTGELWARAYYHNENIRGFNSVIKPDGRYIVSPDGKKKFKISSGGKSSKSMIQPKSTPRLAESALYTSLANVLQARELAERMGYSDNPLTRNTYHSMLTRHSNMQILGKLLNPIAYRRAIITSTTINDIIADPETYLSEALLKEMNGDLSEGNVYYRLREFVEQNFDGVSIDRTSNTHRYVLVDNDTFDDLLRHNIRDLSTDFKNTSLYERYNSVDGVPITEFYTITELNRLGIDLDTKIVINPDVRSETIRNADNPNGVIHIMATEKTTNGKLIDTINHEFRHLLQLYNLLETGFTMNFNVTKEMIADVKKHVPEIFVDAGIREWATAATKNSTTTVDEKITQLFVYLLTGGELNAYGISASLLSAKPAYATHEAGKPVIFMPWYNAKTGEGRHKTDYIAMRADDELPINPPKATGTKGISLRDFPVEKKKPKDTRPRYFSKAKAKGTNLERFADAGISQLDPAMQDFVIATTGREKILPPELWNAIKLCKLTRERFNEWFRTVDLKRVNQQTFNLINKHLFKNDFIKTPAQLKEYLGYKAAEIWALNVLLLRKGAPYKDLLAQNDYEVFIQTMKNAENLSFYEEALNLAKNFDNYTVDYNDKGEPIKEHIGVSEKTEGYMRIYAMMYFNGSYAGAARTANAFRRKLFADEDERRTSRKSATSLDATVEGAKGDDKDRTKGDLIGDDDIDTDAGTAITDLFALYDETRDDMRDTVIAHLDWTKYQHDVEKYLTTVNASESTIARLRERFYDIDAVKKETAQMEKRSDLTEKEQNKLKNHKRVIAQYNKIEKANSAFRRALDNMSIAELGARYEIAIRAEHSGKDAPNAIFDINRTFARELSPTAEAQEKDIGLSASRVNVVSRIKRKGEKILNAIRDKTIKFEDLSPEVQALFTVEYYSDNTGKRRRTIRLNPDAYSVGRGRQKLPGLTDTGRGLYERKFNLLDDNTVYRHSTDTILENERVLADALNKIDELVDAQKETERVAKKKAEDTKKELAKAKRKIVELEQKLKDGVDYRTLPHTEVTIKTKKEKTNDKPNNFTIISGIDMPPRLQNLFDVSFNEMADTLVQFASRNEKGELFDKKTMSAKEFDSRTKHEVANWEAYYEKVRPQLLDLTRKDVFDIIEFFEHGMTTFTGDINKLQAFEVYLLGYFVDGARTNDFSWNFSAAELEHLEQLFEAKASTVGSALNAVKQMRDVINPMKIIKQRMFDDFVSVSDGDKMELIHMVDDLKAETNPDAIKKKSAALAKRLTEIEKREFETQQKFKPARWSKEWWLNLLKKIGSFRYTAMLSGPITGVRNDTSNVNLTVLNNAADVTGQIIFAARGKKAYRDDQWDLSRNTQVAPEVKEFIDTFIKDNALFDPLYDISGKYDMRQRTTLRKEKTVFIELLTSKVEARFAANHRFDTKTFQLWSKYVNWLMSDAKFVKYATRKYFGKILTIEWKKGNVKIDSLNDDVLDLLAEAVILANRDYMHKRSAISDMIDSIRDDHPELYGVLTTWLPFVNSSWNWFVEKAFRYSPFGLADAIIRSATLEKQIAKQKDLRENKEKRRLTYDSRLTEYLVRRDIGKGTIGILLYVFGTILIYLGWLALEEDKNTKKFFMTIGDIKVDISEIFGTSSLLIGASMAQVFVKQEDGNKMSFEDALSLATEYFIDGFFVNDIIQRHSWNKTGWERVLTEFESFAISFVPQLFQTFAAISNNEEIRYTSGFEGVWERWVNSWHPGQPAGEREIDVFTGEVKSKFALPLFGELFKKGLIFGARVYFYDISDGEHLAREYGVNKNELTGELTLTLKDGTKKEYQLDREALNIKYGTLNKESLSKITSQTHYVEMPDGTFKTLHWDKLSDEQRTRVIQKTMTQNAQIAKIYIWTQEMGGKYYATDSMFATLRKLGITRNVYRGDKGFVE